MKMGPLTMLQVSRDLLKWLWRMLELVRRSNKAVIICMMNVVIKNGVFFVFLPRLSCGCTIRYDG